MFGYFYSKLPQRMFALVIPIVVAAWLVTVPTVIANSSFLALVALLMAFAWILHTTYKNAQPAASLAQALHDADRTSSPKQQRRDR